MKFTLNEKYILNEKFILTEADNSKLADETKTIIIEQLNNTFDDINKKITNYATSIDVSKTLADISAQIEQNRKDKVDYTIIQGNIAEFISIFDQFYKNLNKKNTAQYSDFTELLSKLKDGVTKKKITTTGGVKSTAEAYEELLTNYDKLQVIIKTVFNSATAHIDAGLIKDIQTTQKNILDKIHSINFYTFSDTMLTDAAKLIDDTTSITLNEAELIADPNAYFSSYKNNKLDKIKEAVDNIETLSNTADKEQADKDIADTAKNMQVEIPWQEYFKQLGLGKTIKVSGKTYTKPEELWDYYYKTEWSKSKWAKSNENAINKLKTLGGAFVIELNELGYTKRNNPFISFLQTPGVLENITPGAYAGIHNAYVYEYISVADLRGENNATQYNIIFNKNLYSFSGGEVENYLKLQADIIKESKNIDNIKLAAIKNRYGDNQSQLVLDIFTGNPVVPDNKYKQGKNSDAINPIARVKELYKTIFNKEAEDLNKKPQFNLSNRLKTQLSNNKDIAIKLVNLIIVSFSKQSDKNEIDKLLNNTTGFDRNLQFTKTDEAASYRQQLSSTFDMNKNIVTTIKSILEAAEFEIKE